MRSFVLAAGIALAGSGCGLVDPDITNFDLYVNEKRFTVDTEQWELTGVDEFTATECAGSAGVCAVGAMAACTEGQCFGQCDGETDTCQLQIQVALWQEVNIDTENPELRDISDEPIIEVEIDAIEYEVGENTLNVPTPEFTLYAAPSTIMSPGDPEAKPIGTIAAVDATTLVPRTTVDITAEGRETLADFMGDHGTPFNIIIGSQLVVGMGDTVPSGALSATVQVRAHAGL